MKKLIVLLLASLTIFAQTGTVTRASFTTVTATAINGMSTMVCVFTNPSPPSLHIVCSVNSVVRLTQDLAVQISPTTGSTGAYDEAGNNITWILTQPTANLFSYDIAANSTHATGNF